MIELERTFLVKHLPEGLSSCESKEVLDIYFPASEHHPTLRVRKNGDRFVIKLLRRVEEGESVELEVLRELCPCENARVPELAGHVELSYGNSRSATLVIVEGYVPNRGDAWTFTVDEAQRYFERVLTGLQEAETPPVAAGGVVELIQREPPQVAVDRIGGYLDVARQLGRRTGELHLALGGATDNRAFAPEQSTSLSRRSLYQSVRNLAIRNLELLASHVDQLDEPVAGVARQVLKRRRDITTGLRAVLDGPDIGQRIRVHGDYHLAQVLHTGNDFVIIDFEGEPLRSLVERRRKRSPLADVAGMLRSFHYAIFGSLTHGVTESRVRREDVGLLEPWAQSWHSWVSAAFVGAYLESIGSTGLVPADAANRALLLDLYLVEKALYEIGYELNNRPDWVAIPLRGILDVLNAQQRRE